MHGVVHQRRLPFLLAAAVALLLGGAAAQGQGQTNSQLFSDLLTQYVPGRVEYVGRVHQYEEENERVPIQDYSTGPPPGWVFVSPQEGWRKVDATFVPATGPPASRRLLAGTHRTLSSSNSSRISGGGGSSSKGSEDNDTLPAEALLNFPDGDVNGWVGQAPPAVASLLGTTLLEIAGTASQPVASSGEHTYGLPLPCAGPGVGLKASMACVTRWPLFTTRCWPVSSSTELQVGKKRWSITGLTL
jgi:hypothetical protein